MVQPYFIPPPLVKLKPQFPLFKFFLPATKHLTISKHTLREGALELKLRAGSQAESVTVEDALKAITAACG